VTVHAEGVVQQAAIPMPIQVVIDDVGWWSGEDGHERGEPYRTGVARDHVPADYEAIAALGKALGMRPQAAMVVCEWDRDNVLRHAPSCTWMGREWDNRRWVGPWLDRAADVIRRNQAHIEVTLHGVGHEYWIDGRMERAEWHDRQGRMRPREDVLLHLDMCARILGQHGLGPFPESFVPAAFLHRFGDDEGGLAAILREAGIRHISTPFSAMHTSRPPEHDCFGFDAGVITVDRGHDLCRWFEVGPRPGGALDGPICGMHWPNLLHADPERNHEVVERWAAFLKPYDLRCDTMLAPDTRAFASQLAFHHLAQIAIAGDTIHVNLAAISAAPAHHHGGPLAIRLVAAERLEFQCEEAAIRATRVLRDEGKTLYDVVLAPPAGARRMRIVFGPARTHRADQSSPPL